MDTPKPTNSSQNKNIVQPQPLKNKTNPPEKETQEEDSSTGEMEKEELKLLLEKQEEYNIKDYSKAYPTELLTEEELNLLAEKQKKQEEPSPSASSNKKATWIRKKA